MINHTPGPWNVAGSGHASAFIPGADAVRVWGPDRAGVSEILTRKSLGEKGPSAEMMANAHLIAAAPELLAALGYILEGATPAEKGKVLVSRLGVERARAAIALAVGE